MEKTKRKFPVLAVIAVILAVLAVGMLFLLLAPGPRMHWALTMGEKYLTQGNYEQAVTMFTRAIQVDDRAEAAYLGRAEAYTQLGDNEAAEADLTFIIDELGTGDAEVYLTRAAVYDALHQPEKAQADRDAAQKMGADVTEPDTTPEPTATPKPTKTVSLPTMVTGYYDGVQSYRETFHYSSDGIMLEYGFSSDNSNTLETYDHHGYLTKTMNSYNNDDRMNQYNNDGRLISSTSITTGDTNTYTYDDHGNQTYFNTTANWDYGTTMYYSYAYDDQGRIQHALGGMEQNSNDYEFIYTYNEDGSYTLDEYGRAMDYFHRVVTFTADGIPQELHIYGTDESISTADVTYDAFGNVLLEYERNEDGSPAYQVENTYDSRGRMLSSTYTQLNPDALLPGMSASTTTTYTYTFDNDGNAIGCEVYDNGTLTRSIAYEVHEVTPEYVKTHLHADGVPISIADDPADYYSWRYNRYAVLN